MLRKTMRFRWILDFALRTFGICLAPKILFLHSIIFFLKSMGISLFQISLLQTLPAPPVPPVPPAQPAPPASPEPTGEAQTYILIFIQIYGCFRLEKQLMGQKLRVFVCSEHSLNFRVQRNIVPLLL